MKIYVIQYHNMLKGKKIQNTKTFLTKEGADWVFNNLKQRPKVHRNLTRYEMEPTSTLVSARSFL